MKKTIIFMSISLLVGVGMIGKAFLLNESAKFYLLIFFAVGMSLGLLRLFVNSSIKKMKGKSWTHKVLFFGILLGLGLPFQSWFRNNVLLSIDSSYLISCIITLIVGMIFMTTCFSYMKNKTKTNLVA